MQARILLLFWRTWFVRNEITHGSKAPPIQVSVNFLTKYWGELCSIRHDSKQSDKYGKQPVRNSLEKQKEASPKSIKKWQAPPTGWIKINVDGAFDTTTGDAGLGVVIRDDQGRTLLCSWRVLFQANSAKETEAMAVTEGLQLAVEWCKEKAVLEVDCLSVVSLLKKV
ncbi:hypothetical protein PR202_gb00488 [Eleusine coracana subsp. coracana]|uniref:RNase H type-1 domain-containing protein n=1 Tax=Eleusine coracana subsp. coracana TaxID=191504 RepID=A0AAV5DTI5_ELECO|nr:hypothetical protein PR202_gb00488 [Eleusine coracana subsp. coracana]